MSYGVWGTTGDLAWPDDLRPYPMRLDSVPNPCRPAYGNRGRFLLRILLGRRPDEAPWLRAQGAGEVFRIAQGRLEIRTEPVEGHL